MQENGYFEEAARHFSEVIENGEGAYLISAYLNRAQAYKDEKKFASSLDDIKYLQTSGKYSEPYHLDALSAEIHMRIGNRKKSVILFEKALAGIKPSEDQGNWKAQLRLAYIIALIQDYQFDKAEQQVRENLRAVIPKKVEEAMNPINYAFLSIIQILNGEYENAMINAEKAVFSPQKYMIFPIGAIAANKMGKYDDAIEIIEEYISQKPLSTEQSAYFKQLEAKLWKVEKKPDLKKVTLPQEKNASLMRSLEYRLVASHKIEIDGNTTRKNSKLGIKMKFNHKG